MPPTKPGPPRRYTITRETLEKALTGRRAAKERREAAEYARAEKIAADEARKLAEHNRDPHVKLYRRERRHRGVRSSAQLTEAKAIYDRFWESERERRKGGRPKRVSRHPDGRA